jgi:hypothetical protein
MGLFAFLVGCSPITVKENAVPQTQTGIFWTAKDPIDVSGASAIKGEKKAALVVFRVGFAQGRNQGAHARGAFSGPGTATATARTKLLGLDTATYQNVANEVYRHFLEELKSAGFEVVEHAALQHNPSYAAMAAVESPKAVDSSVAGNVIFFAPAEMKLAMLPGDEGALSGFNALSPNDPSRVIPKIVAEMGVSAMAVTYYVDYVNAEGDGGFIATRASVSVGPGLSVRPGSGLQFYGYAASKCSGFCPNTTAALKLGQAVYSTEPFGEFVDVTQAEGAQIALSVFTGLTTGSVRRWKDFEMRADPAKYQAITTRILREANAKLVQAMGEKK